MLSQVHQDTILWRCDIQERHTAGLRKLYALIEMLSTNNKVTICSRYCELSWKVPAIDCRGM